MNVPGIAREPRPTRRRIVVVLVLTAIGALAVGCNAVATADDWASHTTGAPVGALMELSQTPGSYPAAHGGMKREDSTPSGGAWYRYPLGRHCDVLFEADGQGVIRGWRSEGPDC